MKKPSPIIGRLSIYQIQPYEKYGPAGVAMVIAKAFGTDMRERQPSSTLNTPIFFCVCVFLHYNHW